MVGLQSWTKNVYLGFPGFLNLSSRKPLLSRLIQLQRNLYSIVLGQIYRGNPVCQQTPPTVYSQYFWDSVHWFKSRADPAAFLILCNFCDNLKKILNKKILKSVFQQFITFSQTDILYLAGESKEMPSSLSLCFEEKKIWV